MAKKSHELPFKSSDPEVQKFFEKLIIQIDKLQDQLAECRASNVLLSREIEVYKRRFTPYLKSVVKGIEERNAEERKNKIKS